MSLLGALTPLGKVARRYWIRSVIAYAIGGAVSAAFVGMLLGAIGRVILGDTRRGLAFYVVGSVAIILAAREMGWIRFQLPELKRQAEKVWAHEFGIVTASAMWGVHIGLGFATRMTYGGFWILVGFSMVFGEPSYGAVLLLAYWMGRILPVSLAPMLVRSGMPITELPELIFADGRLYHRLVGCGLLWCAALGYLRVSPLVLLC